MSFTCCASRRFAEAFLASSASRAIRSSLAFLSIRSCKETDCFATLDVAVARVGDIFVVGSLVLLVYGATFLVWPLPTGTVCFRTLSSSPARRLFLSAAWTIAFKVRGFFVAAVAGLALLLVVGGGISSLVDAEGVDDCPFVVALLAGAAVVALPTGTRCFLTSGSSPARRLFFLASSNMSVKVMDLFKEVLIGCGAVLLADVGGAIRLCGAF